ncbi:hypothetical protein Tco_0429367 [Tanacetum coccineum]
MVGKSSNKADSNGWTWIFRNNKEDYGTSLSNIWIGNYHVYVTVARFQRSDTVHDVSKVTLAKLKEVGSMSSLYRIFRNEGFDGLKIHHVGRLWIWIQFPSVDACMAFKSNVCMMQIASLIKYVTPTFKVDERMIWVKISGLLLCAWGSNAFKKMASVFGKFMFFEDEQSSTMSMGKVCISTNSQTFLFEKVHIDIHGEIFKVQVQELGTWSINIIDDYLDSSSNDNGDKEEKVCDSVDEEADNGMENIFNNDNEIKEGEDCNVSDFKDHPFNNDDCNVMNEDSNNCNDQLITT